MSWYFFGGFSAYLMRAVGAVVEPLGMLAHPRVIGRALDREVERDLHAELRGAAHEAVEVVERAELGVDGVVAALGAADRPRAARIAGPRASACCSAPCGGRGRSGGWAAGRRRRSPSPRRARAGPRRRGTCRARPASRRERGKNSYQAAKRARSRSTDELVLAVGQRGVGAVEVASISARRAPHRPAARHRLGLASAPSPSSAQPLAQAWRRRPRRPGRRPRAPARRPPAARWRRPGRRRRACRVGAARSGTGSGRASIVKPVARDWPRR